MSPLNGSEVAIVTGGARGIGFAVASTLVQACDTAPRRRTLEELVNTWTSRYPERFETAGGFDAWRQGVWSVKSRRYAVDARRRQR